MKVVLKETGELERELSIEIASDDVESAMEKKYSEIRSTVSLKGFRKGKAPLNVVKSMYAEQVRYDVADDLIKETYPKAIDEQSLKVATRPTVTDMDFSDEGGFKYTAKVEVFPEISSVKSDNLTVETIELEPTDEQVDEAVDYMLREASELRAVDREVCADDLVVVDLKKLSDSKDAIPQQEFAGSEVDLGYKLTVKEFREELPGMKVGDEKEISVHYDADYSDPAFAGAEIKYLCKVKEVKERLMPTLDDAFAKSTGQVETALELRLKIRERLKQQNEDNLGRVNKRQIIRQICEQNPVTIPEGLVKQYLDSVVEEYNKNENKTEKLSETELREKYRPSAENGMRWDLLWRRVAEIEKIEVLPSDTETWINGFAKANQVDVEQATSYLRSRGKLSELQNSLLEEKVLELLLNKASKVPIKK